MTGPITLTLKQIRKARPCGLQRGSNTGYDLLRKTLGEGYGDDTPITFRQIAESNGSDDAFWCTKVLGDEHKPMLSLLSADIVERVLPLQEATCPNDTREEIKKATKAAAWEAARAAVRAAARAAAWEAAWAAACEGGGEAVWEAAEEAAEEAERQAQLELLYKYTNC